MLTCTHSRECAYLQIPELANEINCVPDVPKFTKNQEPKMTVSSVSPTKEKKKKEKGKKAKEQRNLEHKEVAMVFSTCSSRGWERVIKPFCAGPVHVKSEFLNRCLSGAVWKIHCHARVGGLVFFHWKLLMGTALAAPYRFA